MTETTIYIQKELTPEVIKSLDKEEAYIGILRKPKNGETKEQICSKYELGEYIGEYSHILLPVKVTKDMVEGVAYNKSIKIYDRVENPYPSYAYQEGFENCIDWLLNYKEDNK